MFETTSIEALFSRDSVCVDLASLSRTDGGYTVEELIAALESTTTTKHLLLLWQDSGGGATPESIRRVAKSLYRCISNLRRKNEHHPLLHWEMHIFVIEDSVSLYLLREALVAAKQFEIRRMTLDVDFVPFQALVDFCRDNSKLKVLELQDVTVSHRETALPLPLNDGPPDVPIGVFLDKLTLLDVKFENSAAAASFAGLVARMNFLALQIGAPVAAEHKHTVSIVPEYKIPAVERLELDDGCRMEHFQAALEAGTSSVIQLEVVIDFEDDGDATARLELLASMIRRAVKLNSLTIIVTADSPYGHIAHPRLFQALDACATVTQIQVDTNTTRFDDPFLLQRYAFRNQFLAIFVGNPNALPAHVVLWLMHQFDSCPTGLYMLARHLPGLLSFDQLYELHLSRRRTNPPAPTESNETL